MVLPSAFGGKFLEVQGLGTSLKLKDSVFSHAEDLETSGGKHACFPK